MTGTVEQFDIHKAINDLRLALKEASGQLEDYAASMKARRRSGGDLTRSDVAQHIGHWSALEHLLQEVADRLEDLRKVAGAEGDWADVGL